MDKTLTYKPYGEQAILIEWDPKINETIITDIILYKTKIAETKSTSIEDLIIGYHSLLIVYKHPIDSASEIAELTSIYNTKRTTTQPSNYQWEIPVCYDQIYGMDLVAISETLHYTIDDIITLHTQPVYTVYFMGFLPGFLYLGGLDKRLHIDRKSTPRLQVPKGAVAIGGSQTGVYPQESAGGWNIIGNTPLPFFDITTKDLCFAKSGDQIRFTAISKDRYLSIQEDIKKGVYQFSKTLLND